MWVVRTLLERGYRVRGTVRTVTEDKSNFMIEYFKSLGYEDKFEVIFVDDRDIVKVGNWHLSTIPLSLTLNSRKAHLTRQSKL